MEKEVLVRARNEELLASLKKSEKSTDADNASSSLESASLQDSASLKDTASLQETASLRAGKLDENKFESELVKHENEADVEVRSIL